MKKRRYGFSLIELMVALVIVGLLAAFGYPQYTKYQARNRRAEAWGVILELSQYMERNYLNNNSYTNAGVYPTPPISSVPRTGGTAYYTITISGPQAMDHNWGDGSTVAYGYQITATPTGLMSGDPCGNLIAIQPGSNGNYLVKFAYPLLSGLTFNGGTVTGNNLSSTGEWCF